MAFDLRDEFVEIGTGGEPTDHELSREGIRRRRGAARPRWSRWSPEWIDDSSSLFPMEQASCAARRYWGEATASGRIQQNEIIPDNRNGEDKRVDAIEHPAVSG